MARKPSRLPDGSRISEALTVGVLARSFPLDRVRASLVATGKASVRERELPAHVMVYYVLAMALFTQVCCREVLRWLLEGAQWLLGPEMPCKITGKSGISQARTRLGWEPLKQLYEERVRPVAQQRTRGAWYRHWRVVTLDGSTLEVADTQENQQAFGRPAASRGSSAYPQLRFVSLVENGTHVLFGAQMGSYDTGEVTLAQQALPRLGAGQLCLADRNFLGYGLWTQAQATGADLLWRAKRNLRLPCHQRLADGSYRSWIYPSEKDRRHHRHGLLVRVIEYRLEGVATSETFYRLLTTILEPHQAPAAELAALYQERWEIETALDEFKTHLRGAQMVLRSKTPELVRQEFYGFLMAHFAVRALMHEAALQANEDPDRLSFVHAVRVIRRKLPLFITFPLGRTRGLTPSRAPRDSAGTGRLQSRSANPQGRQTKDEQLPVAAPRNIALGQDRLPFLHTGT